MKFFLFSISLIILLIFLNKNKNKKNYYLVFFSIYLSIFFLENIFKLYLDLNPKLQLKKNIEVYKKKNKENYDLREPIQVFEDLTKKYSNVSHVVKPMKLKLKNGNEIFSASGLANSLTINCNENGYYSTYQSDRFGFNNPDNEWDNKEVDFVMVGDSYTQGSCVNHPNDLASQFREITGSNVINLGYGGNGPLIEYMSLKEYTKNIKIKNIVWIFYEGNDLLDLEIELKNNILLRYLTEDQFTQNLSQKQNEIDFEIKKKISNKELEKKNSEKVSFNRYLFDRFKLFSLRYLIMDIKKKSNKKLVKKELYQILSKALDYSISKNANFYFVYLPEFETIKNNQNKKNYRKILSKLGHNKIKIIDINQFMLSKKDPLMYYPFRNNGHFNEIGYKVVAEEILKQLN